MLFKLINGNRRYFFPSVLYYYGLHVHFGLSLKLYKIRNIYIDCHPDVNPNDNIKTYEMLKCYLL